MDDVKLSRDFGKIISLQGRRQDLPKGRGKSFPKQPDAMTKVRVYQLTTRVNV